MICPDCKKRMMLVEQNGRKIFRCSNLKRCKTTHLATDRGKPMGYVADKKTRRARCIAHEAFDALWKNEGYMTRKEAYKWLAEVTQLSQKEAHISRFNTQQCYDIAKKAENLIKEMDWKDWIGQNEKVCR